MSTPVTRGELRAELAKFELKLDQKLDQNSIRSSSPGEERCGARIADSEQRVIVEVVRCIADSEHRVIAEVVRCIADSEQRVIAEVVRCIADSEQRVIAELARHVRAIQEALSTQVSVIDEKDRDLPRRVRRLQAKVFAHRRR